MTNRRQQADALLHAGDSARLPTQTSVRAKDERCTREPAGRERWARGQPEDEELRPLLLVDVDGVISLFGFDVRRRPAGSFHSIEGIPHFLSARAAGHLLELWPLFELVWASGWEEKANEYLPHLLGLPGPLPHLSFERSVGASNAHWKLDAIDAHCGARPLAWIDDSVNRACHEWAAARHAPTLLVQTLPERGLTEQEAQHLRTWRSTLVTGARTKTNP